VVPPASREPGRPAAATAAETRKRILRAAREVFSELGYNAATFQAIAVRADLTRPAINHYFSEKGELYRQVVHDVNEVMVTAGIESAQRGTTLTGRVYAFIDAARQADIENQNAAAFLIRVAWKSQRHPELDHREPASMRSIREFLSWAVRDAIHRGELDSDTDVVALTGLLVALLLGLGFYAGFVASRDELDAVIGQFQRLLAGGLERRPAPR
jgi:AcrR family transcriptional regulator